MDATEDQTPLLERLAVLLTAARAYRDAWVGCSFPMGPLACGVYWERLNAAIAALDEQPDRAKKPLPPICTCGHWQHLHKGACSACGCTNYKRAV
jgi:hypothetical protein